MNQDEIIAMAREASSMARLPWNGEWIFRSKKELMAFAALVAEKAAAKEREACAQECVEISVDYWMGDAQFEAATRCCNAIRARVTKEGV